MCTMDNIANKKQYKIIAKTLIKSGSFAISDLERGNNISREQIGKILKALFSQGILIKNARMGSGVRYKLVTKTAGLTFLLYNIDQITIDCIANAWDVSVVSAKKYIKKFVDNGVIEKIGKPPKKINYILVQQKTSHDYPIEQKETINRHYAHTTPEGRLFEGIRGFEYFVIDRYGKESIKKAVQKYIEIRREYYGSLTNIKMIDATGKLEHLFKKNIYIEKLFYSDFDKLPIFEATQLYQLITIAKAGQTNIDIAMQIINKIGSNINGIINKYEVDCVGFIPPTIMRKTQLITLFKRRLNITQPKIKIKKATNFLPVQQKSLTRVKDRQLNAKKTILVDSIKKYESILLIDDVVGSGATLNETAKKILDQDIAQKVYAFAAVGPAKLSEFEIIPEE